MRKALIKSLEQYQKWRKGAEIPMPRPNDISKWIEDCIRILRNLSDEQVNKILNDKKSD